MSERFGPERTRRWLGIAGAVLVIAIPIALVAATWEPLEPLPRGAGSLEAEDEPGQDRSRERPSQERRSDATPERSRQGERRQIEAVPITATPAP